MEVQYQMIVDCLLEKEKKQGNRVYLRQPRDGAWHDYTWHDIMQAAKRVAQFLRDEGLQPGSHVSIFSKNCVEWVIADFGITLAGMVSVPLFPNQHEESIAYILQHAAVELVFVGKLDAPVKTARFIPKSYKTVSFDYHPAVTTDFTWAQVMQTTPQMEVVRPTPEMLYTIIYSSGTTGTPKGVMFTHDAIAHYVSLFPRDVERITVLKRRHHLISYLPLAHVYERSSVLLASIALDSDVSFVQGAEQFAKNLNEIQPTLFTAVPRIWAVFKQKIEQKMPEERLSRLLKLPIVSRFVKQKIRKQLGLGRTNSAISGAAHLPVDALAFFDRLGLKILEGYGQTENLGYATLSLRNQRKPGYVGTPRYGVVVKRDPSGELLLQSPCLMKGYYHDETATEASFTSDGWLRTGDLAEIDAEGRVKILGRISENFKNQKGEFISPTPIEKSFESLSVLEHFCLIGRALPNNVLLVNLSDSGKTFSKPAIEEKLLTHLREVNQTLIAYERVRHIIIVISSWTIENGFLTPTLKIKRRVIEERYQTLIENITAHAKPGSILWEADY